MTSLPSSLARENLKFGSQRQPPDGWNDEFPSSLVRARHVTRATTERPFVEHSARHLLSSTHVRVDARRVDGDDAQDARERDRRRWDDDVDNESVETAMRGRAMGERSRRDV